MKIKIEPPPFTLDHVANIVVIQKLYQDGFLSDESFIEARKTLRHADSWYVWANRVLLLFGSALVLAGIIFFFAYNWSAMGKFLKFVLIEFGIIACVIVSYYRGLDRLSGKTLILSASVLVGVLLAVYGQTYQTGADAFELFRSWALLILGWVIISEFSALWFLWLIIINTGIILFWKQVGQPSLMIRYEWLCMAIAALNGLALAIREVGVKFGLEWLKSEWLRAILLIGTLVSLSVPTIDLIMQFSSTNRITVLASCIWALFALGAYICYRFTIRDMIPLAIIVMNGCIILLTAIGKSLFHDRHGDAGIALLFALIILAVASGAVFWLRKTKTSITDEINRSEIL